MSLLVYKFHAAITEFPEDSWREFEILSNATLTQLAAAVMAAFEIKPKFDWYIEDKDRRYEQVIPFTNEFMQRGFEMRETDPAFVLLQDFNFPRSRKKLLMRYNKNSIWDFSIRYMGKRETARLENSYTLPLFTGGKGGPHMESADAVTAKEIMKLQKAGTDTSRDCTLTIFMGQRDNKWRYDSFDVDNLCETFRDACIRNEFAYRGYNPDVWYGYASPDAR